MAFDLTAACSGFVVGLVTAAQYIRTGSYRNILVIGGDALSRYVDWRDRGECSVHTSIYHSLMIRAEQITIVCILGLVASPCAWPAVCRQHACQSPPGNKQHA